MLINKRSAIGSTDSSGRQTSGYILATHYDPFLAQEPPPWFPTISKLTLQRCWWESPIVK